MYFRGKGVPEDEAQGLAWVKKAADQGFPEAQYKIGTGYRTGFALPMDRSEAVKWYQKAAKQGHVKAQYYLGELLANGQGVDEDYITSYAWMFLAKSANDEQAEKNIKILEREMSKEQLNEAKTLVAELQKQIFNKW